MEPTNNNSAATPAAQQRPLGLIITGNARLVTTETVRAALGGDIASVNELIDQGKLWAFDLSAKRGRIREVRVWIGTLPGCEVGLPKNSFADQLTTILFHISGTASELSSAQLLERLSIDDNTLHRLVSLGALTASKRRDGATLRYWVPRRALHTFLSARLIA